MSGIGKQARVLTAAQQDALLSYATTRRHSARTKAMLLLSIRAGLRAKEIAALTWGMLTDDLSGMSLPNSATKGRSGRALPISSDLQTALEVLRSAERNPSYHTPIIKSERAPHGHMTSASIQLTFSRIYAALGFAGCSSHSGRRTFLTQAARNIAKVGGSLEDVRQLAGHSNIATTQRYLESDPRTRRALIEVMYRNGD